MILLFFLFVLITAAAGQGNDRTVGSECATGKETLFTFVFDDVSSLEPGSRDSLIQSRFGLRWLIVMRRNADHLGLFLGVDANQQRGEENWSVEVEAEFKIKGGSCFPAKNIERTFDSKSLPYGWPEFIEWNKMMESFVIDDKLNVEVRVRILKMSGIRENMSGIGKKNLMSFEDDKKQFSDVVLVVENQKFYVSKLFLASQSSYFEILFLQKADESKINLRNIDANAFQNFLELIHGENPINDSSIDGIVHLADRYAAKLAVRKCEVFLVESSEKGLKERLKLAHRYSLTNLRDFCLDKITSEDEITAILTSGTGEMDPYVVGELVKKLLAAQKKNVIIISTLSFVCFLITGGFLVLFF